MSEKINGSLSTAANSNKDRRWVNIGMGLLLCALPLTALAATPWYSQGESHTLTLTKNGTVWALGGNDYGQLGNGTFLREVLEPKRVNGLDSVIAVSAGSNHSVALKSDGTVWTWGFNRTGQLGNGTTEFSPTPNKVSGLSDVKAIATGGAHVVALKKDGTVWAWGGNQSGQLGNGTNFDCKRPAQIPGLSNVIAIVAGAYNTSALKADGTVWSWGFNGAGQLGNGSNVKSNIPIQVSGATDIIAIGAGDWHVTALRRDGTVWAWGNNNMNQLGVTKISYSFSPVQVEGIGNITDIISSSGHTIAIAKNDTVWAWGGVGARQWGNGTSLNGSPTPVQVSGYNGPTAVAAVVNPETVLKAEIANISKPDYSQYALSLGNESKVIMSASRTLY